MSRNNQIFRYGWVQFDSEASMNKASDLLSTFALKDFSFSIVKSQSQKRSVRVFSRLDKKSIIESARSLIQALDKDKKIFENPLLASSLSGKTLDLQLLYLRRVHAYCYFSGQQF